ncbi:MAG TPA: hypothetical protein VFC02_10100 [Anaerolineales bacterium]|nr:hypothetical protein [Anaerolineales bacterium]
MESLILRFLFLGFAALNVLGVWHITQSMGFEINPRIIVATVFAIANLFAAWWIPRWIRRPTPTDFHQPQS